jgi:hypothetical protein
MYMYPMVLQELETCPEWQKCDFYGTGACEDVACTVDTAKDMCGTLYCNSDNVCASCASEDDNCPDDYECGVSICMPSEDLSTGALIGIIIGAVAGVLILAGVVFYCMKKDKGNNQRESAMHDALT